MANGNNEPKEEKVKMCPFLKEYCIKERCAVWSELTKQMGGLKQVVGLCAMSAMILLLSEINAKTLPPKQVVKLPKLYRG